MVINILFHKVLNNYIKISIKDKDNSRGCEYCLIFDSHIVYWLDILLIRKVYIYDSNEYWFLYGLNIICYYIVKDFFLK